MKVLTDIQKRQERPDVKFDYFFREYYNEELQTLAGSYPLKKSLIVDFKKLEQYDASLADYVLFEPEEAIRMGEDAIKQIALPIEDEFHIHLRFCNLPESQHVKIRDIRSDHIKKLVVLNGIVKTSNEVRPECIKATFECPQCSQKIGIEQDEKKLKEPTICENPECLRRGKFKLVDKVLVDVQRIKLQEPPELLLGSEQPSQIYARLKEDLVAPSERKKTFPGCRVNIIGIIRDMPTTLQTGAQSTRFDIYMDVNYVETIEQEYAEITLTDKDIKEIKKLSKDPQIYDRLIKSTAPTIFGYERIKEAILLQLFGGVRKVQPDGTVIKGDIHTLLVGDPGTAKSQLLRYVSRLAPKGKYVSGKSATGAGLTATAVKDEFAGGWTLEAGALVLANMGTACIDEFDKMSSEDRSAMHEALEQQTISIAKAGIMATLNARTAVLAAANPKYGRFDRYRNLSEQIDISPVLLSRFDLKFAVQDIPETERDKRLAKHVLSSFMDAKEIVPELSNEFIRKYVSYAKKMNPVLTESASSAIEEFYTSWRNMYAGEGGESPIALTPRQLEALVRLSEASARVRLNNKATRKDAKRAIAILEYSLRELGMEPETGRIDIDKIDTGISSRQRSKIHTIFEIIEELEDEVGPKIPLESVIDSAKGKGFTEDDAEKIINRLKTDGDLFEPRPGLIQRTKRI